MTLVTRSLVVVTSGKVNTTVALVGVTVCTSRKPPLPELSDGSHTWQVKGMFLFHGAS